MTGKKLNIFAKKRSCLLNLVAINALHGEGDALATCVLAGCNLWTVTECEKKCSTSAPIAQLVEQLICSVVSGSILRQVAALDGNVEVNWCQIRGNLSSFGCWQSRAKLSEATWIERVET